MLDNLRAKRHVNRVVGKGHECHIAAYQCLGMKLCASFKVPRGQVGSDGYGVEAEYLSKVFTRSATRVENDIAASADLSQCSLHRCHTKLVPPRRPEVGKS